MTNTSVDIKRPRLRAWRTGPNGKGKTLGGRWNMARMAEVFIESQRKSFTLDDLARLVYGTTGKKYRENVRKHIPAQRNYMMALTKFPLVTRYGPRGTIQSVKAFDHTEQNDVVSLNYELGRLVSRGEMTEQKAEQLRTILLSASRNCAREYCMTTQFDLFASRQARDKGLEQVSANSGDFMERAMAWLMRREKGEVTGEDIRMELTALGILPHDPHAWGALTRNAIRLNMLIRTGKYQPMTDIRSHARMTAVYWKR